ncbi:MAG TPA: stage II sporulation protein M [Stellaceae bacterium]|nr:stage II sporulation protein M [Stellaceae bacterium]
MRVFETSLADQATVAAQTAAAQPARQVVALKSSEFRKGREKSWTELETLIGRIDQSGIRSLSGDELERLPLLYRAALSSLSVARSIALDRNLRLYLENLSFRAFLAVYGPRESMFESIGEFLLRGFPRAVRKVGWHLLVAFLALAVGVVAGYALTVSEEAWFNAFVPGGLAEGRGPSSTRDELLHDEIFAPWPGFAKSFALFASFLFSHNTMVGIFCFALGIAGGVPTLLLLVYQGLVLGSFIALHANRGLTVEILGWLSIHGVTEILAILLCGAAGLVVAERILFPERRSRLESIAAGGQGAAPIAIGAMLLFLVAGILEGGFRQLVANTDMRFAIGGFTGLLWFSYFVFCAREPRR